MGGADISKFRSLAQAIVVAFVCALATATSATAAEGVPVLTSVTTISGSHSGYTEVELTEPLRPFDEDRPEIAFQGGGEMIGVALRPPPDRLGASEPTFHAYSPGGVGQFRGFSEYTEHDGTLPPGLYRLYLIAEQPGSVTIEFTALDPGQLALQPAVETPQRSGPIPTRTSDGIVKFSERFTLWGGGVIFLTAFPTPRIGTQLELCSYWPNQEEQAGERAYDPGCPYGHSNYKSSITSEGEGAFSFTAPSHHWAGGVGGNVTDLIGEPGPVDTYLFTAGYDRGPPPALTSDPGPGSETGEDPPVLGPLTADQPPGGELTREPTQDASGAGEPCDGSCSRRWATASLASRRALLRGRDTRVRVACAATGPCRGKVGFVSTRTRRFRLRAGGRIHVRIVVPRSIRRRARRTGRARGRVAVTSRLEDKRVQVQQRMRIRPDP